MGWGTIGQLVDKQSAGQQLIQHWFITAYIELISIQGLYTVCNGAEVQGTVATLELAGNQEHRQPPQGLAMRDV
jgi:hypothetical protein